MSFEYANFSHDARINGGPKAYRQKLIASGYARRIKDERYALIGLSAVAVSYIAAKAVCPIVRNKIEQRRKEKKASHK